MELEFQGGGDLGQGLWSYWLSHLPHPPDLWILGEKWEQQVREAWESQGLLNSGFQASTATVLLWNGRKKNHKLLLYQASKRGFYIHLPILQERCISWDSNICYKILYIPYQCWLLVYNSSPRYLRGGGGLQFRGTVEGWENILKCNMWRASPSPWGR